MAGIDDERTTMHQLRAAVRQAIGAQSVESAAARAEVSPATLFRVLRWENVTVKTVARVCARLEAPLEIHIKRNSNI